MSFVAGLIVGAVAPKNTAKAIGIAIASGIDVLLLLAKASVDTLDGIAWIELLVLVFMCGGSVIYYLSNRDDVETTKFETWLEQEKERKRQDQ